MMVALLVLGAAFGADFDYQGTTTTLHAPGIGVVWPVDLAVTAVGIGAYLGTGDIQPPSGRSDPRGLDGLDPHWNPGLEIPSDFLGHPLKFHAETLFVNGPVLSVVGGGIVGGLAGSDARSGLADALLVTESIALTGGVVTAVKGAVGRPRPFTATAFREAFPDAWASRDVQQMYGKEDHYDAFKSFPSGHTSSAGAAYGSLATLLWIHSAPDLTINGTFWAAHGTALALTAATGALRVGYGVHHPTDVIAGGLFGLGVGVAVPLLHRSFEPGRHKRGATLRIRPGMRQVALTAIF